MTDTVYLDNAATTFPKSEDVYRKMDEINRSLAVNAGRGSYALAKKAVKVMDKVRTELLALAKANQVAEVVLTPSATIALNQIIGGMDWKETDIVYVSPFEHNAVVRTLHLHQKKAGFTVKELPVKKEGFPAIDIAQMEYVFTQNPPTHVYMTHVSNVTGYILPVQKIAAAAKQYQAEVIVDASQSLGLIPVDLKAWDVDYMVFAGHKTLYGPLGIGGFFIRHGKVLNPYLAGGTGSDSLNPDMPKSAPDAYEAASFNIVAAGGLLAALEALKAFGRGEYAAGIEQILKQERAMAKRLIEGLKAIPDVYLYLPDEKEHTGIVAFNIKGFRSADVGMILDEDYNIAVRTGYHCAPLVHKYLKVDGFAGVVRASVGRFTTETEVNRVIDAVRETVEG